MPLHADFETVFVRLDGFDDPVLGSGGDAHPLSDLGDALVVQAVDLAVAVAQQ